MNNDLISREVLKKEFAKHEDNKGYLQADWEVLIDNAPTVEYPFYQEAYQTGYEEGQNERPQGEWIEKVETKQFGYGWLTTHETVCSVCGGSGENDEGIPQCWKFCPNCGAAMKGGAE